MKKVIMVAAAICVFLGGSSLAAPQTADARCFRGVLRRVFIPASRLIRRRCSSQQVSVSTEVVVEQQGYAIKPLVARPLRVVRCTDGKCNK